MTRATTLAFLLAALSACNKTPEPEGTGRAPASAEPAPKPAAKAAADVTWDAPAGWQKAENPSPMRKATYKIPRAAGDPEDAELSVSQAGGSVDLNVKRWAAQFEAKPADVKREPKDVNGLKVTVVELRGTYSGMAMPGAPSAGPKPGYALLGAIVETTTPTFFKLTGPEKTVAAAHDDFLKLVASLRAK